MAAVRLICGVDEAGRGPLAGPVCAAAVVFDPRRRAPAGIADSKVLSVRERERLTILIKDRALAWAIALSTTVAARLCVAASSASLAFLSLASSWS